MAEAYIYDAVRTPRGRGKKDGSLYDVTPVQLAAAALCAVRDRTGIDTALIDDVILGCVEPVGEQGAVIARTAVIVAGYAETVAGMQINRFCSSGLDAVNLAAAKVAAGEVEFAIGGGVESMSRVPMGSSGGAMWSDPQVAHLAYFVPQGISADLIATMYGYSRGDVDAYAMSSQQRAAAAWAQDRFARSVVAVVDSNGDTVLARDEYLRPQTTRETLASLKPAFATLGERAGFDAVAIQRYPQVERIEHVHTAGNSSGIVDGAAAVLVGSREAGRRAGLVPRARIRAAASIGSEPAIMLTGPVPAVRKALAKAGMTVADIDLFEVNEAFAVVAMAVMQKVEIPHEKINVNGGAVALGHPIGMTGARLILTALYELRRRGGRYAIATPCIGGGEATAILLEAT